jgi:hypothetical protein
MTFSIIAVACILVSTYSYIDKSEAPIQCLIDKGVGVPEAVINRYCWIMSTFTLPKHFTGVPGKDILHHGVGRKKVYLFMLAILLHIVAQWFPTGVYKEIFLN